MKFNHELYNFNLNVHINSNSSLFQLIKSDNESFSHTERRGICTINFTKEDGKGGGGVFLFDIAQTPEEFKMYSQWSKIPSVTEVSRNYFLQKRL